MTSGNVAPETITSEPVIVNVPNAEKSTAEVNDKKGVEETKVEPIVNEPGPGERERIIEERRSYRQPVRVVQRDYSRSRSPRRAVGFEVDVLTNTTSLNHILADTDVCVETIRGQLIYMTSHPFHTGDLQKFEWLFHLGTLESWIQKPMPNSVQFDLPRAGPQNRQVYYDDGYDAPYNNGFRSGGPVPIARLGAALRIFKEDSDPLVSKVKFLTVVQVRNDSAWVKLIVSHSRQAAASDVCHELLNGHSIIFMGAVLRDVAVPAENQYLKAKKLVRVASVEEAEKVEEGVIGVIC
jgi:hypothetical protein